MAAIRAIAISTELADVVRKTKKDPRYGFPAYTDASAGAAPCRHCLRLIAVGEKSTLFTYDAFEGIETLPLPGPVYVHADACERYAEDAGFPEMLRKSPRTLNAYARGARLLAQEFVEDGKVDAAIERIFARPDVAYVHVRSTTAGCYTFRIEKMK